MNIGKRNLDLIFFATDMYAIAITQAAKDSYRVRMELGNLDGVSGLTGSFVLEIHPKWAPLGAHRFKEMLDSDFFNDIRFFRVIHGFMAQVVKGGTCNNVSTLPTYISVNNE